MLDCCWSLKRLSHIGQRRDDEPDLVEGKEGVNACDLIIITYWNLEGLELNVRDFSRRSDPVRQKKP
jgi:hypothetical protein